MNTKSIALIFDNTQRPETTGTYCLSALIELATVQHVLPAQIDSLAAQQFDLYLRIDDGLDYHLPAHLRPSAWWAIDTHMDFERCLAQARTCDLTFAAQRDGTESLRHAGIPSATWLPLACDPAIHRKHDLPKQFDFSFVGNIFPGPRADLLERLRRKFRQHFIGRCYFEEMARTYSASRTVFNCSVKNDINMRVFEALACGSLLLTNDLSANGQADLFTNGVHLATYNDAEDLLDKLDYHLRHEDIRSKIENAGRQEVVAKHTYRQRMEQILMAAEKMPTSVAVTAPPPVAACAKPQAATGSGYDPGYFEFDRPELLALVPENARDVLDIGCGAGRLGRTLKERQKARVTGIEFDPRAARAARGCLDEVHEGDIESMNLPFAEGSFDAVICGDVLEHLRDPLTILRRVRKWLRPTGRLIASVPNVRHHSVVRSLLAGNWTYEAAGLLDRTHLRFFTRREIEKLLFRAGFTLEPMAVNTTSSHDDWVAAGRPGEVRIGNLHIGNLSPQEAQEFHIYQYLVRATPAPPTDFGQTSIIILTHGQLEFTRRCVDSIFLLTDEPFELIIVDNGSKDGTPEYLHSLQASDPRVKVIFNNENRGFPAGCNQGIAIAEGRQILLLNNDTVVTTGWLRRMLQALQSDSKIGLVGPCSDNISGEQQVPAGFTTMEELDGFAWDWAHQHDHVVQDNDRLVGFCLLIRRQLIDTIGVLDERFRIGCFEDDDYCRRALQAGFRAVIARDAFIHHYGGATFRASDIDFGGLMQQNEERFREKWAVDLTPVPEPEPIPSFVLRAAATGGLLLEHHGILLSACLIVRDNEKIIAECINSLKPWVDEIIILDTGSLDRTAQIAESLGARVYHFKWCDSFSAARNESIKYARGKWIFWMDSDDVINEANGKKLRALAYGPHEPNVLGYSVQVRFKGDNPDGDGGTEVDHVKLFRNLPHLRFEQRIHEQILPAIQRAGGRYIMTDIFVIHANYDTSPEGQQRKKERDLRLLHMEYAENPQHPFTLFNLGMTYDDIGEHEKATGYLRECLKHSVPQAAHVRRAYAILVNALTRLNRLDEALSECEDGLRLRPLDTELRFRRAQLKHVTGKYIEAVQGYNDVLDRPEPRDFASYDPGLRGEKTRINLALVYEELGQLAQAEQQWRAVIAEVPHRRFAWGKLVQNLCKAGKLDEAEHVVADLGQRNGPLAGEMPVALARLAMARQDPVEARRLLEATIHQFPDDLDALCFWAELLFNYFSPGEAEPALMRILALEPQNGNAWHNLAIAQSANKRYPEAVQSCQQSLCLRPDSPRTLLDLGRALWQCSRNAEAIEAWEVALRLAPGFPEAIEELRGVGRTPAIQ